MVLLLLFTGCVGLADTPKEEPILVTDAAKVEAQLGKTATIRGKVTRTGQSKGGLQFLNFANYHFVVVCFPDAVAKFENGAPVDAFKDKTIEITGAVVKYQDRFQIKLERPDQIRIIAEDLPTEDQAPTDSSKELEPGTPSTPSAKDDKETSPKKPVDPKKFFD